MKPTSTLLFAATLVLGGSALFAQDANPIASTLKQSWTNVNGLLTKMADKMPDDAYRFKPTPELQDFGQRMAHIAGANMRTCASLKGEQKPLQFSQAPTKAEITSALKQVTEECDSAFGSLTDAEAMKMVSGRGSMRPRFRCRRWHDRTFPGNVRLHGYLPPAQGHCPPSSDRNES